MGHRGDARVSARQQITGEVHPCGIHGFNEPDFPRTIPLLDLTLPCNCGIRVFNQLEVHESLDISILSETRNQTFAMLNEPANQVGCHARSHRAGAIGQDVDVEGTLSIHCETPLLAAQAKALTSLVPINRDSHLWVTDTKANAWNEVSGKSLALAGFSCLPARPAQPSSAEIALSSLL